VCRRSWTRSFSWPISATAERDGPRDEVVDFGGLGVDLPTLAKRAQAARERLAAANADNRALFQRLSGLVNAFCPGLAKTPYHVERFAGGPYTH